MKIWKMTASEPARREYERLHRETERFINREHNSYIKRSVVETRRNAAKLWKFIKRYVKSVVVPSFPDPAKPNRYIVDPLLKARFLNEAFVSCFTQCSDHCNTSNDFWMSATEITDPILPEIVISVGRRENGSTIS